MVATNRFNHDPYEDILKQILAEVSQLRQKIEINATQRLQKYQDNYHCGNFSKSAFNLAHYLAMRQFDLRHLQDRLAQAGLSSLGRAEASVLSTLDSLIDVLKRATDKHYLPGDPPPANMDLTGVSNCCSNILSNYSGPFMSSVERM
ncbi:MAG: hypothetical protein WAW61_06275 [Methylococcaceae bacterium]